MTGSHWQGNRAVPRPDPACRWQTRPGLAGDHVPGKLGGRRDRGGSLGCSGQDAPRCQHHRQSTV